MSVYLNNIPQASDRLSVSQGQFLVNFGQLNTQFGIDHVPFNNSGSNGSGFHKQVTFTAPVAAAGTGTIGIEHTQNGTGIQFNGNPIPFFSNSVGDYPMIPDLKKAAGNDWSFKIGPIIFNMGFISVSAGTFSTKGTGTATYQTGFGTTTLSATCSQYGTGINNGYTIGSNNNTSMTVTSVLNNQPAFTVYYLAIGY
jgi:hypothetical protein